MVNEVLHSVSNKSIELVVVVLVVVLEITILRD